MHKDITVEFTFAKISNVAKQSYISRKAYVLMKILSSPRLPRVTRISESKYSTSKLEVRCCLEGLRNSGSCGIMISGKFPCDERLLSY